VGARLKSISWAVKAPWRGHRRLLPGAKTTPSCYFPHPRISGIFGSTVSPPPPNPYATPLAFDTCCHALVVLCESRVGRYGDHRHRGARFLAPDNTLAGQRLAYELGADIAECDVRLSKDRVPVLMHDREMVSTTGQPGFIDSYTLAS